MQWNRKLSQIPETSSSTFLKTKKNVKYNFIKRFKNFQVATPNGQQLQQLQVVPISSIQGVYHKLYSFK